MKLAAYVKTWAALALLLGWELFALNWAPSLSVLRALQHRHVLAADADLSPQPGSTMSLWFGWLGFGIMALTNIYILRKRFGWFKTHGRLSGWLDFHIFCGLTGPLLIVFHTNFHVRGLVAVSFWSMVVSFLSGIVGRYLYVQVLAQKAELAHRIQRLDEKIGKLGVSAAVGARAKKEAFAIAGGSAAGASDAQSGICGASLVTSIANSVLGDLRLTFGATGSLPAELSPGARKAIVSHALTRRRLLYLEHFRKMMGYWHAFHVPFAIFMYVVALIHIVAELVFFMT